MKTFIANIESVQIPNNFDEDIADRKWKHVIAKEQRTLYKNETCEIIDLLKVKRRIRKW